MNGTDKDWVVDAIADDSIVASTLMQLSEWHRLPPETTPLETEPRRRKGLRQKRSRKGTLARIKYADQEKDEELKKVTSPVTPLSRSCGVVSPSAGDGCEASASESSKGKSKEKDEELKKVTSPVTPLSRSCGVGSPSAGDGCETSASGPSKRKPKVFVPTAKDSDPPINQPSSKSQGKRPAAEKPEDTLPFLEPIRNLIDEFDQDSQVCYMNRVDLYNLQMRMLVAGLHLQSRAYERGKLDPQKEIPVSSLIPLFSVKELQIKCQDLLRRCEGSEAEANLLRKSLVRKDEAIAASQSELAKARADLTNAQAEIETSKAEQQEKLDNATTALEEAKVALEELQTFRLQEKNAHDEAMSRIVEKAAIIMEGAQTAAAQWSELLAEKYLEITRLKSSATSSKNL